MKRKAVMVGALLTALIMLTTIVAAPAIASPLMSDPIITVRIVNLPENVVFADILIKIDENDPNFTVVNEGNLALFGLDAQAGIVGFNNNGFMSFTFHYLNAAAEIRVAEIRDHDDNFLGQNVRFGGCWRQFGD